MGLPQFKEINILPGNMDAFPRDKYNIYLISGGILTDYDKKRKHGLREIVQPDLLPLKFIPTDNPDVTAILSILLLKNESKGGLIIEANRARNTIFMHEAGSDRLHDLNERVYREFGDFVITRD